MVDFKVRTLKVIYKKYGYNMIGTKNALCNQEWLSSFTLKVQWYGGQEKVHV